MYFCNHTLCPQHPSRCTQRKTRIKKNNQQTPSSPMHRFRTILLIFLGTVSFASAQLYVGLHKDSILIRVKKDLRYFLPDNSAKNEQYRYLKFVDQVNEETLYCFLSDNDICTSTRLISDYTNLRSRVQWLDKQYKRQNDSTWYFTHHGRKYQVLLKKEDWFFVLITKPQ